MGSDDILFEFQLLLMNLNIRNICMWVLFVEGCQKGDADEIYSEQYTPHWAVMLFLIDFYCEYVKNRFVNYCMSVILNGIVVFVNQQRSLQWRFGCLSLKGFWKSVPPKGWVLGEIRTLRERGCA